MVASDSFTEFLREQFAPLGRVTMRRMLGKRPACSETV
jgi:DNA transformation protein